MARIPKATKADKFSPARRPEKKNLRPVRVDVVQVPEAPASAGAAPGPQTAGQTGGMILLASLGQLLDLGEMRIRQLSKAGYLPKIEAGRIHMVQGVQGYIKFLRAEDRRSTKSQAESRVRDARADEILLRSAERTRDLIPADEAIAAFSSLCAFVAAGVNSIPATVTRDLELRRQIEDAVRNFLADLADKVAEKGRNVRSGRGDIEADGPDNA